MALDIDRPHRPWIRALGTVAMICLRLMILCSAALGATPDEVRNIIAEEAAKNGQVPLSLALAVAKVESDLRPDAVSSAGARGVMQIMPATAMSEFGVPASALSDPRLNVRLGIAYLERLHNRYGDWELALSHYNGGSLPAPAGESGSKQYVAHDYTRQYVADVMKWDAAYRSDAPAPAQTLVAQAEPAAAPPPVAVAPPEAPAAPLQVASAAPAARVEAAPVPAAAPAATAYPPLEDLRARFRAHFDQSASDRIRAPAPAAGSATASAAPMRSGRFNYGPYGG